MLYESTSSFRCDMSLANNKLDLGRIITGQGPFQVVHAHLGEARSFHFCVYDILLAEKQHELTSGMPLS